MSVRSAVPALALSLLTGLTSASAPVPLLAQVESPPYLLRQLSPNGEAASRVASWRIDPRGEWIAFIGDVEIAGAEAVYTMRRNGSELHRLSGYAPLDTIEQILFTANGRRVVYYGDLEVNGRREIWSAPPWGDPASAVKLNGPLTGSGAVNVLVAPTGSRVVYTAETASGFQVWSVPGAGPAASGVRIDPGLEGDEFPILIATRPDGNAVVIQLHDFTAETTRLFTVPIAGPPASAVLLAEGDPGGCHPYFAGFTPNSSRGLYFGLCPTGMGGELPTELWSVPAGGPGSAAVSLAGSLATGGAVGYFAISPDSQRVVFLADKLVNDRVEIFTVPINGPAGAGVRLNASFASAASDVIGIPVISPDSTRVAYVADALLDERFFPYAVPIDGSTAPVSLYSGVAMIAGDAKEVAFLPDSSAVVFRMDLVVDERFDLFVRPADGSGTQARITNRGTIPPPPRSVSTPWEVHPDGTRVVYVFDELAAGDKRGIGEQLIGDFYQADLRLDGIPVTGGSISGFELYPGGAGLAYRCDENQDEKFEIFTVDTRIFGDGFESATQAAWGDLP